MESTLQYVIGHHTVLTPVLGQPAALEYGPQRLLAHQSLDAMQAAVMSHFQDVAPHTPRTIGTVTGHKAVAHLGTDDLVAQTLLATGAHQPSEKPPRETPSASHI